MNHITGKSGCAIIEAILAGERSPVVLAGFADFRVKKSKKEIAQSLGGNWDKSFLFVLNQHYREYLQVKESIKECEKAIDEVFGQPFYFIENRILIKSA